MKLAPNDRVQAFGGIRGWQPLSLFSVVDDNAASVPGGLFVRAGNPALDADGRPKFFTQGYAGVANDSTPTMTAGAFAPTGDDVLRVQYEAGSLTGPVLPPTMNFTMLSPQGLSAGMPFTFIATQTGTATGPTVRVQASTTLLVENSWTDVPGGTMQATGGGRWTLTTSNAPVTSDASRPDYYRAVAAAAGYHDGVSMFAVATVHPSFFNGEAALQNGVYYLSFPNNDYFGYYSYLSDSHYIYHFALGYEYVFDAADGHSGVYLYDFKSNGFFYTSPGFPFSYLYDFSLNSVVYYYPAPSNPGHYNTNGYRFFYVFNTGKIIVK